MICFIVGLIVGFILIGIASEAISGAVYLHLIRTGHVNPAGAKVVSLIASFILISATVVIAGWIILGTFRFER